MKKTSIFAAIFLLFQALHAEQGGMLQNNYEDFLPYETDQYTYLVEVAETSAAGDIVIEPEVISDVITKNSFNTGCVRILITTQTQNGMTTITTQTWKTKNPSYITVTNGILAAGAVATTALLYKFLTQKTLYELAMEAFELRMQIHAEKVSLLKERLERRNIDPSKLNLPLLVDFVGDYSDEQFESFMQDVQKDSSQSITMESMFPVLHKDRKLNYIDHALAEPQVYLNSIRDEKQKYSKPLTFFGIDFSRWFFNFSQADAEELRMIKYLESRNPLYIAYHESAHALTNTEHCNIPKFATLNVTQLESGVTFPHTQMMLSGHGFYNMLSSPQGFSNYLKNQIEMLVAGGTAYHFVHHPHKDKTPATEFFSEQNIALLGMSLDMQDLKKYATCYYNFEHDLPLNTPVDQQDIDHIVEQAYDAVYDKLKSQQDTLERMAHNLYQHEILHDETIYNIAQSKRPQYIYEMTLKEHLYGIYQIACNVASYYCKTTSAN